MYVDVCCTAVFALYVWVVWGADDVVLVLCVYVLSLFAYFFSGLILSHSFGIEQDLTTSSLFFPVKGRIWFPLEKNSLFKTKFLKNKLLHSSWKVAM